MSERVTVVPETAAVVPLREAASSSTLTVKWAFGTVVPLRSWSKVSTMLMPSDAVVAAHEHGRGVVHPVGAVAARHESAVRAAPRLPFRVMVAPFPAIGSRRIPIPGLVDSSVASTVYSNTSAVPGEPPLYPASRSPVFPVPPIENLSVGEPALTSTVTGLLNLAVNCTTSFVV